MKTSDAKLAELEALMNQAAAGLVMGGDYISMMLHAAPKLIADLRDYAIIKNELQAACDTWGDRALAAEAERDRLREALAECVIESPHNGVTRSGPPCPDCLCRWCKARRLLAGKP
jgi:hypothetical protein